LWSKERVKIAVVVATAAIVFSAPRIFVSMRGYAATSFLARA